MVVWIPEGETCWPPWTSEVGRQVAAGSGSSLLHIIRVLSGVWHMRCLFSVLLSPRHLFPFSTPACCASINALSTSLAHLMYSLTWSPSFLFSLTLCSLLRLRPSGLRLKLFLRMLDSPLLPSSIYPVLDCLICMKVTWIRLIPSSSKLLCAVVLWF